MGSVVKVHSHSAHKMHRIYCQKWQCDIRHRGWGKSIHKVMHRAYMHQLSVDHGESAQVDLNVFKPLPGIGHFDIRA